MYINDLNSVLDITIVSNKRFTAKPHHQSLETEQSEETNTKKKNP